MILSFIQNFLQMPPDIGNCFLLINYLYEVIKNYPLWINCGKIAQNLFISQENKHAIR